MGLIFSIANLFRLHLQYIPTKFDFGEETSEGFLQSFEEFASLRLNISGASVGNIV